MSNTEETRRISDAAERSEPKERPARKLEDAILTEMAERKLEVFLKQHTMKEIAALNPELKEDILKEALIEVFKDEADQETFTQSPIITSGDGLLYERIIRDVGATSALLEANVPSGPSLADSLRPLEPLRPVDPRRPPSLGDRVVPVRPTVLLSVRTRLLDVGQTMPIYATPFPNIMSPAIDWNSSNPAVASISEYREYSIFHPLLGVVYILLPLPPGEGLIHARSVGTTIISAQSQETGAIGAVEITVQIFPKSLTVEPEWKFVYPGRPLQLTATISPANATDKSVTWLSTHPEIASVTDTGLVTAHQNVYSIPGVFVSIITQTNLGGITVVSRLYNPPN